MFSDFEDDGPMWDGEGRRESRQRVDFPDASSRTRRPVSLAMWDISNGANARADLRPKQIGPTASRSSFRTWGDTRVARVRTTWLAIGSVRDDDDWDVA